MLEAVERAEESACRHGRLDAAGARRRRGDRRAAQRAAARRSAPRPTRRGSRATGAARASGRWLEEHAAKALLREAGIPVPDGRRDRGRRGRLARARRAGRDQAHRRAPQGARGRRGAEPGRRDEHPRRAGTRWATASWSSGWRRPALELLVASSATAFVPVLVVGLGGVHTELLDDVAIAPAARDRGAVDDGAAAAARRDAAGRRSPTLAAELAGAARSR